MANFPGTEDLWAGYQKLYQMHPHHLLPLETALPAELQPESRDKYRIVMTMILAPGKGDKPLDRCLGKLFKRHPDFDSFRDPPTKDYIRKLLGNKETGGIGLGLSDPDRSGNGARLWNLLRLYFESWHEKITPYNIQALTGERGFKLHIVRSLEAYCFGNRDAFPLDRPAFRALCNGGMYEYESDIDEVRKDVERKLREKKDVSLIDFHEMLRFIEQYTGKSKQKQKEIIVGWNAWRLLCSAERDQITMNWKWIYEHLVKDRDIAEELWGFYHEIDCC